MNKLKPFNCIMIVKSKLTEVLVYRTYNRISLLGINVYDDKGCTVNEPALLSSAEELKQSALILRPRKHISRRNNGKYIDRRPNGVPLARKILNEL